MGSPSKRFSVLVLAAIVAPATIVAVLGYVSLRQWEGSADLLFREQARDVASMAAEKVEMVLRQREDAFLDRLQALLSEGASSEPALDALLAQFPLIRRLFMLDRRDHLSYPRTGRNDDAVVFGRLLQEIPPGLRARGGRREIVVGDQVLLAAVLKARGEPVLVAFSRDPDVLRRDIFETTLGGLEAPTIIAVLDSSGRPVYSKASLERAERILTVTFRGGLPGWSVAVYLPPGASARQAVRRQVTVFTGAFGVLLVVIVVGIVLVWRLMRREAEMTQLKSDFVANVSHDLKTPLSVIRMFGETLEMDRVPDETRRGEYYRVITRESERLSRLIDNVLDFSRIERGRQTYDMARTAIEPLVRDTLDVFAYPLAQQGFKVETRVPPDLPDVLMDADAVGQALANLIDNAMKYSDARRSITVAAARVGDELAITVTDEGIGIAAEEQGKIFEKFYRVGRSETQGRRGSGIGLALVRHIAEAHRGRVTVESRPGEGSRFTLWLPMTSHA